MKKEWISYSFSSKYRKYLFNRSAEDVTAVKGKRWYKITGSISDDFF